ncbi:MAG: ABC transporter permease [Candidatus Acidiferrales bacterium]|jgi:putative ABC transport system permease protein
MQPLRSSPTEWRETWQLALQALRANKVRAMLTMLGVIIGSACIVLVVTVALAGKRYIVGEIEGVGANLIHASVIHSGPVTLADEITPADLEAVKANVPGVVEAAGTNDMAMSMSVDGQEHPIYLVGVTDGFQKIRNLLVLRGRYLDQDDLRTQSKVCLLTQDLAKLLFPSESPLGKEIGIGELHFTVIGVFKERVASFGLTEIRPESVVVPFSLIKYYTGTEFFKTFYVQADKADDVPMVTTQVQQVLESRHRSEAKYRVENLAGILDAAHKISLALTVLLILVALIALTISGIGIMNIMLVTVTERTREIGIRKAIGARRDAILYQFLMEAVLISGSGALVGIAIAVSIPVIINFLIGFFPEVSGVTIPVSWLSVLLAFMVSCSTGLLFGYLPASRAANLHPTESLRYE